MDGMWVFLLLDSLPNFGGRNPPYFLPIAGRGNRYIRTFLKIVKWNTNNLNKDLNPDNRFHFQNARYATISL